MFKGVNNKLKKELKAEAKQTVIKVFEKIETKLVLHHEGIIIYKKWEANSLSNQMLKSKQRGH